MDIPQPLLSVSALARADRPTLAIRDKMYIFTPDPHGNVRLPFSNGAWTVAAAVDEEEGVYPIDLQLHKDIATTKPPPGEQPPDAAAFAWAQTAHSILPLRARECGNSPIGSAGYFRWA